MAGELLFGADAVTPNTSLSDGFTLRRSGGNLIGTDILKINAGFTILQNESKIAGQGGAISIGPGVNGSVGITCATDNNAAQNPFSITQGTVGGILQTRIAVKGSSGAVPAFVSIGSATALCDFQVHGNVTLTHPDLSAVVISSLGIGGIKLGSNAVDQLGFFGSAPSNQPAAIPNAAGGTIIDTEARAALNALLAAQRTLGLIAT